MINLMLDGTVRTLILTLRARADEQEQDKPLINDPWSAEWYSFMPESEELDAWYNPAFQVASAIRSRLIDDAVEEFIASHDNPLIVELGAGCSTRYFRVGEGKSQWVELDLAEAILVRRKLDMEIDNHWFIASDMTDLNWMNLLPEYDPKNTLFIAEGTLMFIEPDGISVLMEALSEHFSGASFVFDVVNPEYVERANEDFTDINATMRWGVYEDELGKYGLKVTGTSHLLLEYPERWDAIGVDSSKRTKNRSGYVVTATLK